jgi:hypothetical protein
MSDTSSYLQSGISATGITVNSDTGTTCRGVYIGAADNYDLLINGSWVLFNGCAAGSIIPVKANGARHASGDTAPDAGDIVFLY